MDTGFFALIVQNSVATDLLSLSSTTSQISSALNAAASQIPGTSRECSSFGVTRTLSGNGKNLFLTVTFFVDNAEPLTMLDVFTGSLEGLYRISRL
ncbi:hypothetical protein EON64_00760 [archaeon]|nr:MAG: hypothetical protein EON64_00760 [archaeon]